MRATAARLREPCGAAFGRSSAILHADFAEHPGERQCPCAAGRPAEKRQRRPWRIVDGRPIIGICKAWSALTPGKAKLRILAEPVKRGALEAGGLPLESPVTSPGETLTRPTAMLCRSLVSRDLEESIRAPRPVVRQR